MKKVSFYLNAYDKIGKTVFLDDVLFKKNKKVDEFRKIADPDKKRDAKLQMPMFTVSGVFSHRSKKGLLEHSGMICLDIDGKDNPDLNISDFIRSMRFVDEVYYAGLSVSGKGCFIIILISDPSHHEYHFDALCADFARMGANVDKACRDVSRTRFISADPNPCCNPDAQKYEKILMPEFDNKIYYADTRTNIDRLVKKAIDAGVNITQKYEDWFALACSLRGVAGGRDIFHALSAMDSRYDKAESEYQFDAVAGGTGYDERKFFEICRRHGITLK